MEDYAIEVGKLIFNELRSYFLFTIKLIIDGVKKKEFMMKTRTLKLLALALTMGLTAVPSMTLYASEDMSWEEEFWDAEEADREAAELFKEENDAIDAADEVGIDTEGSGYVEDREEVKDRAANYTMDHGDRTKANEFLNLLNKERVSLGIGTLQRDAYLEDLASIRAEEILSDFSHNGAPSTAAECIAVGNTNTAEGLLKIFKGSDAHWSILTDASYKAVGVGVRGNYIVVLTRTDVVKPVSGGTEVDAPSDVTEESNSYSYEETDENAFANSDYWSDENCEDDIISFDDIILIYE